MTIFVFQYAYSGLFTVELVLRLAADGCQFLCGPDWVWSWLDVFIVLRVHSGRLSLRSFMSGMVMPTLRKLLNMFQA